MQAVALALPELEPFTIEFVVPGIAVPWARAGRAGMRSFTKKPQRNFMGAIRDQAGWAMQGHPPLDGPVELSMLALYLWPKSVSPRRRMLPGADWKPSLPDGDNLYKLVADTLQGIVYRKDSQVASIHIWKKFGDRALLKVKVRALA